MDIHAAISEDKRLKRIISAMTVLTGGLLLVVLLLSSVIVSQLSRQSIVMVPAGLTQPATVSTMGVDTNYLQAMSSMLIAARLNVSPATVSASNQLLLQYVDSRYFADFKQLLSEEADEIKKGGISSVFYIQALRIDPENLTVDAIGLLKRHVGERELKPATQHYQLKFRQSGLMLHLISFAQRSDAKKD